MKQKKFARTLDIEQVRSGQWFVELLQKVVHAYDRNARAEYFRQKYPGLALHLNSILHQNYKVCTKITSGLVSFVFVVLVAFDQFLSRRSGFFWTRLR